MGYKVSRIAPPAPPVDPWTWLKKYSISTIIDIGANEGQFADKILPVFPNAEIHCFEPIPDVFGRLQRHFEGNNKVQVHNYGLGEVAEKKQIFTNEYSPSSSMLEMLDLHKSNFDFAVKVEPLYISVARLDDFFSTALARPLLVKIDVQGYEMFVLRGGANVIDQADIVIIETTFQPLYKDQPLFDDIYTWFTARGFYYSGNIEQLLAPVDRHILQADAIFIRSGLTKPS